MQQRQLALALFGFGLALAACDRPTAVEFKSGSMLANQNAQGGAAMGFTDGWQNGTTVLFFYTKNFFCAQPPTSGAPSQCEAGEDGTIDPRPGKKPTLYVMTPIGFRPADATLQCPVVGSCINHPSTIDLSRIFGPGSANVPLPAHSHIIDSQLPESMATGGNVSSDKRGTGTNRSTFWSQPGTAACLVQAFWANAGRPTRNPIPPVWR